MVDRSHYEEYQVGRIADEYAAHGFEVFVGIDLKKLAELLEKNTTIKGGEILQLATVPRQFRFDIVALRRQGYVDAYNTMVEFTHFVIVEILNGVKNEDVLNLKKKMFEGIAKVAPFIEVDFRYIEREEVAPPFSIENRVIFSIHEVLSTRLSRFEKEVVNSPKQILEDWGLCAMTIRSFSEFLNLNETNSRPPLDLYNELLVKQVFVPAEDIDPEKVTHSLFDVFEGVQAAMMGVVLNPLVAVQMRRHLESIREQVRKHIRPKRRYP